MWDFDVYYPELEPPLDEKFERDATWSLRQACLNGGIGLAGFVASAAAIIYTPAAGAAAVLAIAASILSIIGIAGSIASQQMELARLFEELREELRYGACGFPSDQIDVDTLTWQELLTYARQYCSPV